MSYIHQPNSAGPRKGVVGVGGLSGSAGAAAADPLFCQGHDRVLARADHLDGNSGDAYDTEAQAELVFELGILGPYS